MPHCIIEYSKELEDEIPPQFLITATHQGALNSRLFEESHIKSRAIPYEYYKTGISNLRFIHITARILSGRTLEQKADLSQNILTQFVTLIETKSLSAVSLTVEVNDMERNTYSKTIF